MYHVGDIVTVNDTMQASYQYSIQVPMGQNFAPGFNPHFTPKEMLELGVFEENIVMTVKMSSHQNGLPTQKSAMFPTHR